MQRPLNPEHKPVHVYNDKLKWGVYRLDIYNRPGWFLIQLYDNYVDADIYCLMLNQDTGIIHKVFQEA